MSIPFLSAPSGGNSIQGMIVSDATSLGLPPYIPLDIAQIESGFTNPAPYYDVNGYATGVFSTHGGFGGQTLSALENPSVNILVSEKAMLPAYHKGVAMGLSGAALLDYVANNSGWPLSTGVAQANLYEPQYDANLNSVYANTGGRSNVTGGFVGKAAKSVAGGVGQAQDAFVGWGMQIDQELQMSNFSITNPFGSIMSDGRALLVRTSFFIIGLVIILVALSSLASSGFGGAPALAASSEVEDVAPTMESVAL